MMRTITLTGVGCVAAFVAGMAGTAGAAEPVPKELMTPNKRVAEATMRVGLSSTPQDFADALEEIPRPIRLLNER